MHGFLSSNYSTATMNVEGKEQRRVLRLQVSKLSQKVLDFVTANDATKAEASLLTLKDIHDRLHAVSVSY